MAVKTLKTSVGQGIIYIRPIQRLLSVIVIRQEVLSTTSLKEKCIYCGKDFSSKDLISHIDSCFSFPNFESDGAPSTESTSELPPAFDNSPGLNGINDKVNGNSNNESTHNQVLSENAASAFNITYKIVDKSETISQESRLKKLTLMGRRRK